jgi:hypothetical protein
MEVGGMREGPTCTCTTGSVKEDIFGDEVSSTLNVVQIIEDYEMENDEDSIGEK